MRALLLILLTLLSFPAFSASYTKIANNGSVLPDSALLGSGATDWACTRDNTTGLVWEVKTADGRLRDMENAYTNYDSSYGTPAQIDAASNSIGLVNAVNSSKLCGSAGWRMPSKGELVSIVDTAYSPTINTTYFPNTPSSHLYSYFWSGSPSSHYGSGYAWVVFFGNGSVYDNDRSYENLVRLVRSGQSIGTFTLTVNATGSGSIAGNGINCTSSAGTTSDTCSTSLASSTVVTLTATPATGSTFNGWSGACSGAETTCTLTMDAAKWVTAAFGFYTKIANNGSTLPDSAQLGSGATDWACTRDNRTGLIWEVKTADSGLRDMNKTYTNYDSSYGTQAQINAASNSIGFANAVNSIKLCGSADWRMPSEDELFGIVDGAYSWPRIHQGYFPNTPNSYVWSGSPYGSVYGSDSAKYVSFNIGGTGYANRSYGGGSVFLVRGGQSLITFALTVSTTGTGFGTITIPGNGINCTSTAGKSSGTCSASLASSTTVTLTATPASGMTFTGWDGACSGEASTCTLTMDAAKSVTAAFATPMSIRYTKIANNNSVLPDSALLGSGATAWACTHDNTTGLVWEVKTADGGLRDMNRTYTNFDSSDGTPAEIDAASNSIGLVNAVNSIKLCGSAGWRMPSKDELVSILDSAYSFPAINQSYFPNTPPRSSFWSGSPGTYGSGYAWSVSFLFVDAGDAGGGFVRNNSNHVRLVRGGQFFATFALTVSTTGTGSGTLTGNGIDCTSTDGTSSGTCSASFTSNTAVTLTATPASGSSFTGWGGACSSTAPSCTLTLDAAKNVSADFAVIGACDFSYVATITANGYAFAHKYQAFEVLCENGRYGVVRLPRGDNRDALETCAFQQSNGCTKNPSWCVTTPDLLALTRVYAGRNSGRALLDDAVVGPLARWICE